jgi:uncharacterized RDD family membrane protein YckC
VPEKAEDGWRIWAGMTDGALALVAALGATRIVSSDAESVAPFFAVFIPSLLVLSFVNHVIATLLFRASVGKLLWGLRVVRWKDGRRPRFWQTVARWLAGFVLLAVMVMVEETGPGQACGLRIVRRRELIALRRPAR